MKFSLIINDQREELILYSRQENDFTESVRKLCECEGQELIGYLGKNAVVLSLLDVFCFVTEGDRVFAVTQNERLWVKKRLYMLEPVLPKSFIKINQSCIANIQAIERFDASIGGSLTVRFKNGYTDYVSRRNISLVKERMGIK